MGVLEYFKGVPATSKACVAERMPAVAGEVKDANEEAAGAPATASHRLRRRKPAALRAISLPFSPHSVIFSNVT